jgi:hypothetical protein
VPESEKQLAKSTNEKEVRAVIDNFAARTIPAVLIFFKLFLQ